MKTNHPLLLLAGVTTGLALMAAEAPPGAPTNAPPAAVPEVAPAATNANAAADAAPTEAPSPAAAAAIAPALADTNAPAAAATNAEPTITVENGAGGLRFNFHGAPLNLVLEYMSDAAGFIINKQTESLRGTVEVWSKKPVTKDEAVELLNSVLRKNGYAVARNDRILTIFDINGAKTSWSWASGWSPSPMRSRPMTWAPGWFPCIS